jgi:putative PIN family toxin of toxin-antitoxin system
MKRLRVVLDTNVLVAASRSSRGASFALLRMLREGRFTALASVPLLLESEAALKRPEHLAVGGRTVALTDALLDALCLCCEPVDLHYLWRPRARDPADDMVLETALNGRADRLATFNTGNFTAAARFGLAVVHPRELLRQLQEGQS